MICLKFQIFTLEPLVPLNFEIAQSIKQNIIINVHFDARSIAVTARDSTAIPAGSDTFQSVCSARTLAVIFARIPR